MSKRLIPAYLLTFVNVLGFSILMPILPFVVQEYGAPKWVYGLLLTMYSAFQFIGAPILGAMSDSYGRKRILLISQAGTLLSWFVFLFALMLPEYQIYGLSIPLVVIALSRALDGITGGNVSVTNAYVSDITSRKEKSYIFGYLGGIAGIGLIVGPGIGGVTASSSWGFVGTIATAILISCITLVSILLWLKESHHKSMRTEREKSSFWKTIYIPGRVRSIQPSPIIKSIFTIKLLFSSMMGFYIGTVALFLIDLFSFNEIELGYFMFAVGLFLSFNQAFVSKQFIKRYGEFQTLLIGLFLCTVGISSLTFFDNLYYFLACYYFLNLGLSLCFPTFNALISIHANPSKLGEIMGVSESINSLAMAVFPVLAAILYAYFGFSLYYAVSLLPLIALILAIISLRKRGKRAFQNQDQSLHI